jgi:hypothetical protein
MNIIISKFQTKDWRKKQLWYKNGKYQECEKYQLDILKQNTKSNLFKTNIRINLRNISLEDNKKPLLYSNGFDLTENFDYIQYNNNLTFFYNLKMICDNGGAQTRSLREVYHFIECQLKFLLKNKNIFFINILDGDTSYKHIDKFNYLLNLQEYLNIKNIYVGDMFNYIKWYNNFIDNFLIDEI